MRRARRPRGPWLAVAVATAVVVLVSPGPAAAQRRSDAAAIRATCKVTTSFDLPTSPGTIPVMVTYMTNSRRRDDDVQTKLSKDRLRRGFAPDGEFNEVWRPQGIELALVGFRACSYRLASTFDTDLKNPRERVPKPDAGAETFETVFLRVVRDHNTRTVKNGASEVDFRGLDLYLWWDIEGYAGFSVRPRFGRQHEASGRGNDEVPRGRPGAIWLDKNCTEEFNEDKTSDACAGLFAHELGHFLGLCHCCHKAGEPASCINALTPEYCPGLGLRARREISCHTDLMKRLMSAENSHTESERRALLDCEVETAREGAQKVRKLGANGIANTRGR